jgi:hypothetical protein
VSARQIYTERDRREIGRLYVRDLPMADIGARTGASAATIRTIRRELGIKPRDQGGYRGRGRTSADRRKLAVAMFVAEKPYAEIMAATGLARETNRRYAAEDGHPPRKNWLDCCECARLLARHKTTVAVAYVLDCSRAGVSYALLRHQRHTRSETP